MRKKDDLAPLCTRLQRESRTGVYYVLKSMEQGPSFRIIKPKYPVEDPSWRIIAPILRSEAVRFRMKENAFVSVADPGALQAAATLVIVRNRILRPIAGSLFVRPPTASVKPNSKLQAQYRRTTASANPPEMSAESRAPS
ncbi:hypothetical protein ACFLSJ_06860 [Verrucomicrobiota bacterium]